MQENIIKKNSIKAWFLASRPKTLTGAMVPVLIGTSLALSDSNIQCFRVVPAVLCFLFAFIMQIDANFVNDYFDFKKGNDDETRLGPLRACSQGWIDVKSMRKGIIITTLIACVVGFPLVLFGGIEMILIGLLCVFFCFLYTTKLSYMGLGDFLVLVFFGIVPVCMTYYLEMPDGNQVISFEVLVASIACGCVIDTLLIVNNYRDIDNDRNACKNTLVVKLGKSKSRMFYLYIGVFACFLGLVFVFNGHFLATILSLIYLWIHYSTYKHLVRIDKGKELNIVLGETARNMFFYGIMVSFGIILNLFL
jgi:1,4-dihydroxy-2-naphthoate octaprenyltransferase